MFLLGWVFEVLHIKLPRGLIEFNDESGCGEVDVELFGGFDEGFSLVDNQIDQLLPFLNQELITHMEILEYFLFELASRSLNFILLL